MPYTELNFDSHNVVFALSEVKESFRCTLSRVAGM